MKKVFIFSSLAIFLLIAFGTSAFSQIHWLHQTNSPLGNFPHGPWVDARPYVNLSQAINAIGTNEVTLLISKPIDIGASTLTIPPNISLQFLRGGSLILKSNTVNILGSLEAGLWRIFDGNGKIILGNGSVTVVYPEWWGVKKNGKPLADAIAAIGTNEVTLLISEQIDIGPATLTIPPNISLQFLRGGSLILKSNTVNIMGSLEAGLWQIFVRDGRVFWGNGSVTEVYPEWWGAKGDDDIDDTEAIRAAINSLPVGGGIVLFPAPKKYYRISELKLNRKYNINFLGVQGALPADYCTIKATGNSMFNIQECEGLTFRNLRFSGNGTNMHVFVHGGGTHNPDFIWENCHFQDFGVVFQLGYWSKDSLNTYIYNWAIRNCTGRKNIRVFVLEAPSMDGLKIENFFHYDPTEVTTVFLEATQHCSANIIMNHVFASLGKSATHFIKLYGGSLCVTYSRWEASDPTAKPLPKALWLETEKTGGGPIILNGCQAPLPDANGVVMKIYQTGGAIINGGTFNGNIDVWSGVPVTAIQPRFKSGGFTGYLSKVIVINP